MKKILVTGSSGQLGQCLKQQLLSATDISCYFAAREDLDITNSDELYNVFLVNTTLIIVLILQHIPM